MGKRGTHFNELGAQHHRHNRYLGFEKSHHLTRPKDDGTHTHASDGNVNPSEGGVIPEPTEAVKPVCNVGDTKCYTFDDLNRTWAKPSIVAGSNVGASYHYGMYREGQWHDLSAESFVLESSLQSWNEVASMVGHPPGHYAWTTKPAWSTCTGLKFTFSGWILRCSVMDYTVPSHPANMAGMTISLKSSANFGVAPYRTTAVYVGSVMPVSARSGTLVGSFPNGLAGYTTVFIPGALIPAAGSKMYITLAPGWDANYGAICCGFNWPYNTGCENSGWTRGLSQSGDLVWQTYATGDADLGAAPVTGDADTGIDTGEAWWDGGNTLNLLGIGGTPVDYGMAGGTLHLTADDSASLAFSYEGEDDVDGDHPGPWSWDGWSYKWEFMLDVAAIPASTGERKLVFRDVNGNSQVQATVFFGDAGHASSLELDAGGTVVSYPYTFTAGVRYGIRVDTRSGEARARVWPVNSGETAKWLLTSALGDGADNGDRFEFEMYIGNGAANPDQTLYLYGPFTACGMAEECTWAEYFMGVGDDETIQFYTPQRYTRNSLQYRAGGLWTKAIEDDPYDGVFSADYEPSEGMQLHVRFMVGSEFEEG